MIYVFKTTIDSKAKIKKVQKCLDNLGFNLKWNVDLDDIDNVLRIDTDVDISVLIIDNLRMLGFECVELH